MLEQYALASCKPITLDVAPVSIQAPLNLFEYKLLSKPDGEDRDCTDKMRSVCGVDVVFSHNADTGLSSVVVVAVYDCSSDEYRSLAVSEVDSKLS